MWNPATGKRCAQMKGHHGRVPALALQPGGRHVVTGGADGTIRLWDTTTNKERSITAEPAAPIVSLALAPKKTQIALVLSTGQVQLWDRETGNRLPTPIRGQRPSSAAFGADGLLTVVDSLGRLVPLGPEDGRHHDHQDIRIASDKFGSLGGREVDGDDPPRRHSVVARCEGAR